MIVVRVGGQCHTLCGCINNSPTSAVDMCDGERKIGWVDDFTGYEKLRFTVLSFSNISEPVRSFYPLLKANFLEFNAFLRSFGGRFRSDSLLLQNEKGE